MISWASGGPERMCFMNKNESTAADAARTVRVMLMSDAELCHVGATHSKALQFGREFSEEQWIAAAREIEAITIENAIETAKRCLPENTVAALCRLRDSVRPNVELTGAGTASG